MELQRPRLLQQLLRLQPSTCFWAVASQFQHRRSICYVAAADDIDIQVFTQIAEVINNISSTYNMGLQVSVVPVPIGAMVSTALGAQNPYYVYSLGWFADYNWVVDFTGAMYAPYQSYPGPDQVGT